MKKNIETFYKNSLILEIFYICFQRIRQAIKPKLRKHQLRATEDLNKVDYIVDDGPI